MQIRRSSAKSEINEKECTSIMLKPLLYAVLRTGFTNMFDSSIIKMQLLMTSPIIRHISQFLKTARTEIHCNGIKIVDTCFIDIKLW